MQGNNARIGWPNSHANIALIGSRTSFQVRQSINMLAEGLHFYPKGFTKHIA